ncbi:DUF1178 family protein [Palleronia sp. LCG004]|uniref:DUF1178 family protein n=1 Tax=Palleronia sp. LCG004 TaxID=3079304 RepID=UPI002941CEBF|nr:DUF1178 family protein [Palleronia sp. LCG004]WOI55042.1 DUF1178 family protein [Palleronia sp. LCG004]
MIRFALKCSAGHEFEAWFRSGEAYDTLRASDRVNCSECGDTDVEKALMAPGLGAGGEVSLGAGSEHPIARLRREVEEKSDYVGADFAQRARAMHEGKETSRPIYGEAAPGEARALLREGVPILPLPFRPKAKSN